MQLEHVGNALCLDFANTVNARPVVRADWLETADGAQRWAASAGYPISAPTEADLQDLRELRELRELVYRIFRPVAHGGAPQPHDLSDLTCRYADAVTNGALDRTDDAFELTWPQPRTPRVLQWEVVTSAVNLLGHGRLDRVGECPTCSWLFLDTSKNGRRRWCNMATCGSRDKSRRYYARQLGTAPPHR